MVRAVMAALALLALGGCEKPAAAPAAIKVAAPVATDTPSPPAPALVAGKATVLKVNALHHWDAGEDGDPRTYRVGEVTLTFAAFEETRDSYGVNKVGLAALVEAPGMNPYRLGDDETSAITAFGVGRIDMSRPGPQILLGVFTGGAHCCTRYILLTPNGDTWTRTEVGMVDKSTDDWPVDRNGDGEPEMLIGDDRFNYAFASYAGSWAPYVFWQIEGGKVVDVSAHKGFARLHREYMKEAEAYCRQHDNGACAGFAAAAARAGDFDRAWTVVLANYNREDDWDLPKGCKAPLVEGACPEGQEITYANYPDALKAFLRMYGYIP